MAFEFLVWHFNARDISPSGPDSCNLPLFWGKKSILSPTFTLLHWQLFFPFPSHGTVEPCDWHNQWWHITTQYVCGEGTKTKAARQQVIKGSHVLWSFLLWKSMERKWNLKKNQLSGPHLHKLVEENTLCELCLFSSAWRRWQRTAYVPHTSCET